MRPSKQLARVWGLDKSFALILFTAPATFLPSMLTVVLRLKVFDGGGGMAAWGAGPDHCDATRFGPIRFG